MQAYDKKKLSDKVTQDLLRMIQVEGIFKPGEQLPNEVELAQRLGVSRTTLREAQNNLVTQNILTKHRGRGTFVTDVEEAKELASEFDILNYTHARLSALYDLRIMMEPAMAGLAARKATDEEISIIEKLHNQMKDEKLTNEDVIELNRRFHVAIANATHNEFVIKIFHNINNAIAEYFDRDNTEKMNNADMIRSHCLIMHNLKLRDEQGATEAMKLHLSYSVKDFNVEPL